MYYEDEKKKEQAAPTVTPTPGQPAQGGFPGIQSVIQPVGAMAMRQPRDDEPGGGPVEPPAPRPPATTPTPAPRPPRPGGGTPRGGNPGGSGDNPTPAPPPPATGAPTTPTTPRAMTNLGTPGGSVGSFRNIQQFLKTNAGAEADFAQRTYADPMAKDAAAITSASGNIPTPAEYTARSGVSGTTPANTPTIQNQAAEQGYKLGTGATPGAYQSFLQNRGQSAGTSRLDAYLYGATPGGAQEDVRNAQQKFGGLLGLVKNQVPYGSTLSPEGVASPTPTTGTVRSKGPAVRKNEGEDGEGPPGKVWSPYSNSWVSPAMLAKQEGLEELRNSNRGRNPRETP